jgi:hypothetical protein
MNETNGNSNGHASNGNGAADIPGGIACDLPYAAFEQTADTAGRYCSAERQRIEAANQPKIAAAKQELAIVERKLEAITREICKLPPEGDLRNRRRTALFLSVFGLGLCTAGFAAAVYALDPIMPGIAKYGVALGMAVVLPFIVHVAINCWSHSERFMHWLVACDFALAFIAMVSLAYVRFRVSAEQMTQANAAITIDSDAPVVASAPSTFFERTACYVTIFSMCSAVAMELAAGIAFHRAARLWADMPTNAKDLREKHEELECRRIELVRAIEAWQQEPQEFVNRFWANYHEAKLRGNEGNRFTKMFAAALFFLVCWGGMAPAYAAEPLNLVAAIDLTASVGGASGLDQKTELERNVASVGKLLVTVPAGSRVTVIGITDRSFAQPYVLLSARLDGNAGYFQERIKNAHQQLLTAWQKRSQSLVENFQQTDLFGALVMSSQIFEPRDGRRNVLVIFSDMRHETRSLNLAKFSVVPLQPTLDGIASAGLAADLKGVEVYALGVDAAGKSVGYWNSLHDFWLAYFEKAGAKVRAYSILRDLPQL